MSSALLGVVLVIGLCACDGGPPVASGPTVATSTMTIDPPQPDAPNRPVVGALPENFPSAIPVPDDAQIKLAAAEPGDDDLLSVSVSYTTRDSLVSIQKLYRDAFTRAKFTQHSDPTINDVAWNATFSRGTRGELLMVSILDSDDARTVTVGGTVAAD